MLELQAILSDLGLQEYFNKLVEQGFDTWDNLIGIQETDMAILRIKLGHRRKLQREIARRHGHDNNAALSGVQAAPPQVIERGRGGDSSRQDPHAKRRYKRRDLRDSNAPPKDAKDTWSQNAGSAREDESAVADYQQTEAYRVYREKIHWKGPKKKRGGRDGVTSDHASSHIHPPKPESNVFSGTTKGGASKTVQDFLNSQQVESDFAQSSSTAPVC